MFIYTNIQHNQLMCIYIYIHLESYFYSVYNNFIKYYQIVQIGYAFRLRNVLIYTKKKEIFSGQIRLVGNQVISKKWLANLHSATNRDYDLVAVYYGLLIDPCMECIC